MGHSNGKKRKLMHPGMHSYLPSSDTKIIPVGKGIFPEFCGSLFCQKGV